MSNKIPTPLDKLKELYPNDLLRIQTQFKAHPHDQELMGMPYMKMMLRRQLAEKIGESFEHKITESKHGEQLQLELDVTVIPTSSFNKVMDNVRIVSPTIFEQFIDTYVKETRIKSITWDNEMGIWIVNYNYDVEPDTFKNVIEMMEFIEIDSLG